MKSNIENLLSDSDKRPITQEEIDRTSRINMEICATFVAKMIRKYGKEVLQEIEEKKAKESKDESSLNKATTFLEHKNQS